MPSSRDTSVDRRHLLQFLAASPLFAGSGGFALAQELLPRQRYSDPVTWWPHDAGHLIKDPKEAMNGSTRPRRTIGKRSARLSRRLRVL